MCLAQGLQRSDACEARTRGPSVSSQTLYHWTTALPLQHSTKVFCYINTQHGRVYAVDNYMALRV